MLILYRTGIRIFHLLILAASLFPGKARRLIKGRRSTEGSLAGYQSDGEGRTIWMHAASLGEFEQGRPIIEQWKGQHPSDRILVSFFSPSGFEVRRNYPLADRVFYLPVDTRRRMERLVGQIRPDLFLLVKYDFWPEMLRALHRHRVPCCLVSARFRTGQFLLRPAGSFILRELRPFRHIFVQDGASVELLRERGISQVTKAGDTRVDAVLKDGGRPTADREEGTMDGGRRIVVAGSSWPAEERLLAQYWRGEEREKFLADWQLIIAPHEVGETRLKSIEKLFGPEVVRYSDRERSRKNDWSILLIDRIGLLKGIYFEASLAIIGGGFGHGIHNILEPAAAGIPILFGPRYRKFGEATDLIDAGAAWSFNDYNGFERAMDHLLLDADRRTMAGGLALSYLQKNAGSTALIIKHLLQIIPDNKPQNGY